VTPVTPVTDAPRREIAPAQDEYKTGASATAEEDDDLAEYEEIFTFITRKAKPQQ
jgi:hypothetical protein